MSLNLGDLYKHDLRPPNNNPLYQVGQFQGCEQLHDFLSTLNGRQTSQADVSQIPHCAHQSVSPVQNDYLLSSKMIHLLLVHFSTVLIILSLYPLLFTCPEPKQYKRCRPTDPNSDSPAPTGADYMAVQVRFHGKSPSLFHFFKNHCMHQLKGRFSCWRRCTISSRNLHAPQQTPRCASVLLFCGHNSRNFFFLPQGSCSSRDCQKIKTPLERGESDSSQICICLFDIFAYRSSFSSSTFGDAS